MAGAISIVAPERLTKQPGESRVYAVDFSKYGEIEDNAETLTGTPTVAVTPTGELTVGSPNISGNRVRFRVSGGTLAAGEVKEYRFKVTVATSGSNTLVGDGYLFLVD